MLFTSTVLSQASGSVNGLTYSHNRFGRYIRARVTPTNPSTPTQDIIRGYFAEAAVTWRNQLQQLRDDWNAWAAVNPSVNPLGQAMYPSGFQRFVGYYAFARTANLTMPIDLNAPTEMGEAFLTPPTSVVVDASAKTVAFVFDPTDLWANLPTGALVLFVTRQVSPGKSYIVGPYRRAGVLPGAVVPPTSPATLSYPAPFALNAGNKVGLCFRAIDPDRRLSLKFKTQALVVA